MPTGFAQVVPAFKYTATGKRVLEKDFSTLGKLFLDKKAALDFLDLWCSEEIIRDVFFEGIPDHDLTDPFHFGDAVCAAVNNYHLRYGMVPILLAWRDLMEGEIAVVNVGEVGKREKFYPHSYELSSTSPLRKDGYPGDRFMSMVRSAIVGFVNRDDDTLLHLLNQTDSDAVEVSSENSTGSLAVSLYAKARDKVWKEAIAVPTAVTTPHVLRELYRDAWQFIEPPTSLTGVTFGTMSTVDLRIVEPMERSTEYIFGCGNIQKGALYALGLPGVLGVRNVHTPLRVETITVNDKESLFVGSYVSTWVQGRAVGKAQLAL